MRSTFMGLETAKRGMFTQQSALYVTGHNISNANTPGYSRQRVNFAQTEAYPSIGMNSPTLPGQMGTGVKAESIQRIREGFLDLQYRNESNKFGYWNSKSEALARMEEIMNEPSEEGLANTLDQFWNAFQDLSVQPEDAGSRSVVRQRGIAVAETLNYMSNQITAIRNDLDAQINHTEDEINSLLRQINNINKQIGDIEPHGYLPNDLYDARDNLVDQLSGLLKIKVNNTPSGGKPSKIAEGKYTIHLLGENDSVIGTLIDGKNLLVNEIKINKDPQDGFVNEVEIGNRKIDINQFKSTGTLLGLIESYGYKNPNTAPGEPNQVGLYPDMLADLDLLAYNFSQQINAVHQSGWSITEIQQGIKKNFNFFEPLTSIKGAAANLRLSNDIKDDLDNLAASSSSMLYQGTITGPSPKIGVVGAFSGVENPSDPANPYDEVKIEIKYDNSSPPAKWTYSVKDVNGNFLKDSGGNDLDNINLPASNEIFGLKVDTSKATAPTNGDTWSFDINGIGVNPSGESFIGDGSNALKLANVKDFLMNFNGSMTNVQSFYQGVIGDMGVNAEESIRMSKNAVVLMDSVQRNKDSVSSVSLDEEMANMVQFQHAYNASARNLTMIDEMLDKIINGMGRVGL